jgi:hypothetical protein
MDLMATGCEGERGMELAQNRVQWRGLVLAVLNRGVLPSHFLLLCTYNFLQTGYCILTV